MASSVISLDCDESPPPRRKFGGLFGGMSRGGGNRGIGDEPDGDDPYHISGNDGRESVGWFKLMQCVLGDIVEHCNGDSVLEEEADVQKAAAVDFEKTSFAGALDNLEMVLLSVSRSSGGLRECADRTEHSRRETTEFTRRQIEWRHLFEQMRLCYSMGVWSASGLDFRAKADAFRLLSQSASDGLRALVDGAADEISPPSPEGEEDSTRNQLIDVHTWSSALEARQHIVRVALSAKYGGLSTAPTASMIAGAPVVLIIRESSPTMVGGGPEEDRSPAVWEEEEAVHSWQAACLGTCVVRVVDVPIVEQITVVAASVLRRDVDAALAPVLVVLRAGLNSSLASGVEALRRTCDSYNTRLHVEGPSLVLLAQSEPPLRARLCWHFSHTMLLEPALWFGLPSSTVVTYCKDDIPEKEEQSWANGHLARDDASSMMQHGVALADHSLPSLMAFWMFLKRTGAVTLRVMVEEATKLAASLVEQVASIPMMEVSTVGAGGNVLLSYSMSHVDRVMRKYKAKTRVSSVNRALMDELHELCDHLKIAPIVRDGRTWMLFSAANILRLGRFAVPSEASVVEFAAQILKLTQQYSAYNVASGPFEAEVRASPELEAIDLMLVGDVGVFAFGAVRVIPKEIRDEAGDHPDADELAHSLVEDLDAFWRRYQSGLHAYEVELEDGTTVACIASNAFKSKEASVELAKCAGKDVAGVCDKLIQRWRKTYVPIERISKEEQRGGEDRVRRGVKEKGRIEGESDRTDPDGAQSDTDGNSGVEGEEDDDDVCEDAERDEHPSDEEGGFDRADEERLLGDESDGDSEKDRVGREGDRKRMDKARRESLAGSSDDLEDDGDDFSGGEEYEGEDHEGEDPEVQISSSAANGRRGHCYRTSSGSESDSEEDERDARSSELRENEFVQEDEEIRGSQAEGTVRAAFRLGGVFGLFRKQINSSKEVRKLEKSSLSPDADDERGEDSQAEGSQDEDEGESDAHSGDDEDSMDDYEGQAENRGHEVENCRRRDKDQPQKNTLLSWFRRDNGAPVAADDPMKTEERRQAVAHTSEDDEEWDSSFLDSDLQETNNESYTEGLLDTAPGERGSTFAWFRRRRENPAIVEQVVGQDVVQVTEPVDYDEEDDDEDDRSYEEDSRNEDDEDSQNEDEAEHGFEQTEDEDDVEPEPPKRSILSWFGHRRAGTTAEVPATPEEEEDASSDEDDREDVSARMYMSHRGLAGGRRR